MRYLKMFIDVLGLHHRQNILYSFSIRAHESIVK